MKPMMCPVSAPAMPRKKADTAHDLALHSVTGKPIASALSSSSRMALSAKPKRVRCSARIVKKQTIAAAAHNAYKIQSRALKPP